MWLLYAVLGFLLLLAVVVLVVLWALRPRVVSGQGHASQAYRHWAAGLALAGVLLNLVSWATGSMPVAALAGLLFFTGIIMVLFAGLRRLLFLTFSSAH